MTSNTSAPSLARAAGTDRPTRREMTIYGAGEVASNLSWHMVNGFLLYYYTDIARSPAAPLVWLFLLTKILDAFIDIGAGALVDRTRSRWGHARPYLLFASIPFGLTSIMAFCVPDIAVEGKIIYAFVTYGLLGLAYSMVYVPYAALQPLLSDDPRDHNIMGGLRSMGTCIGSIIVFSLTQPLVALAGGGQTGFAVAAAVFASGTIILYLTVFKNTRERITAPAQAPAIWRVVGRMARNRTWLGAFFLMLINFFRIIVIVSALPYVVKLLFGNINLLGVFLTVQSLAVLVGSMLSGPLQNRFSTVKVNLGFVALSAAMFALMPQVQQSAMATLAMFAVASLSVGIFNATAFADCSKAANVQERRFGSRDEGLLASGISFGQKVGGALGTALIAYLLSEAHYDPDEVTASAVSAVHFSFYWLQIILLAAHVPAILLLSGDDETAAPETASATR